MPEPDLMRRHYPPQHRPNPSTERFIFATGIEGSCPTIEGPGGRPLRRDQMAECGHYARWREDLELARSLGCRHLRWGPPYHAVHLAPGRYDWSFPDQVLPAMRRMGIVPILDLCHFGVPDWIGDFQNTDFPRLFAAYARAFAERYPWVRLYTPVNEMYVTAEFSAYTGWWNERLRSHRAFVTALRNATRAALEAMLAILEVRPDALFVMCESSEVTHAQDPALVEHAEMFNERRFLSLDLVSGHRIGSGMYAYLRENGMTEEDYAFYMRHDMREHMVMGHDYYDRNVHLLVGPEQRVAKGELFSYYAIARQYAERYHLPVMHTETNLMEPGAVDWLWRTFANIQQLRHDGTPICGMTWYSLTDQVDWDVALREKNDRVNPLGLFDLDRRIRPVGEAYRSLIADWRDMPVLPNGPLTLVGLGGDCRP